jgi:hypothetical protein
MRGGTDAAAQRRAHPPDADVAYETERLHGLVDGLALHALTSDRKDLRPKAILAVLGKHLAELQPN